MNKRNAKVVFIGIIAAIAVIVAVSFFVFHSAETTASSRIADPDQIIFSAPKDPTKDVFAQENIPIAPAPEGPAEKVAPIGPATVDRDLTGLEGLTGKFYHWDGITGIEITPEGYRNLLVKLDLNPSNPPVALSLSERAANSIGYSSDNPEMRYTLIRKPV